MFITIAQRATKRTSLRCVGGIDVFNVNPHGLSFVLDKGLKLPESPTVQASSDSFSGFNVFSNMGQIFKNNFTHFKTFGFFDNCFANFVVRLFNSPLLFTGDLAERLFCALTAVGLQATAKRKMFVSTMPKVTTAEEPSCTSGGKIVFSDINAQNSFRLNRFNFWKFQDQVEKPVSILGNKFRFLGSSTIKQGSLMFSSRPLNFDSACESIQRKEASLKRISPLVEVNAGSAKVDFWNTVFFNFSQCLLGLVGFTNTEYSVAAHLRAKWSAFPQTGVGKVMQCDSVPAAVLDHNGHQPIASIGISTLQHRQGKSLFVGGLQFEDNRLQHLPSLRNVLGTLDIFFNGVRTYLSRRANIVGWRPKMSAPQPFLEDRKTDKQPSACSSFENFHRIANSNRRWNTQKQVDMVRLNFQCQDFPLSFGANLIQKFLKCFSHFTSQNVVPIFRTPHNVISRLIHAISVCGYVFHVSHSKPCDVACQAAIPPPIETRGFLTEVL